ncbi:DUF4296 domain-containing protein [Arcticibacterium luteifluviistationis]|uniref:DUF4296 domain-containing protein n=1 Tax=Arcticibacterium luteifluviistationis TaxID=1784714 RepID=UPI0019550155|nr:DUF4296 domain-containing protein [Arcticibacterium luteifluviistationis]
MKIIKVLVLALFFTSCGNEDAPENLISEDVMVDLVTQTHILEAQVGRMNLNSYDSARVAFQYLENKLWMEFGVDSAQYNESYEYYAKYPKLFTQIYERVEDKLDAMENEAKEIETAEPITRE